MKVPPMQLSDRIQKRVDLLTRSRTELKSEKVEEAPYRGAMNEPVKPLLNWPPKVFTPGIDDSPLNREV